MYAFIVQFEPCQVELHLGSFRADTQNNAKADIGFERVRSARRDFRGIFNRRPLRQGVMPSNKEPSTWK